jgi:hypothetical protein
MNNPRRLPAVWLIGLTNAPFGLMGGFAVVAVPEMLAAQGVSGGHIAAITAAIISPSFWAFVFVPSSCCSWTGSIRKLQPVTKPIEPARAGNK